MVKVVDYKECDKLFKSMGLVIGDEDEYGQEYARYVISVFDHWLTEDEYANEEKGFFSSSNVELYKKRLMSFFEELYTTTQVFGVIRGNNYGPRILRFDSKEEYLSYIIMGVDEDFFIKLILPEYKMVIFAEINFTWPIFFHKSVSENKDFLLLLEKHKLHLLN